MRLLLDNNLIILCTKPGFFFFGLICRGGKEGGSSDKGSGVSKEPGGLVLRGILGDGGGSGGGGGGGVGKCP